MPRPATAFTRRRLPAGIYYTPRNGGMYVWWNGQPDGQVFYTFDRDLAWTRAPVDRGYLKLWTPTPYHGSAGLGSLARVINLAAEYAHNLAEA
jgi:hypothetical protein